MQYNYFFVVTLQNTMQCISDETTYLKIILLIPLINRRLRDKGEDDKMPPIRKKQRVLLMKLQQEQVIILSLLFVLI